MSTLPHTPGYSRRSHEIAPFHVMSLLARAQALEQAGHDVIHLEIGEPDFTTAEPVVRAGQAALAAGDSLKDPGAYVARLNKLLLELSA